MSQHAGLSLDRWRAFTRTQQILQIGVELHRTLRFVDQGHLEHVRAGYERALRLLDLTVAAQAHVNLRRELLRLRELVAEAFLAERTDPELHRAMLCAVLRLDAGTSEQVALLGLGPASHASRITPPEP